MDRDDALDYQMLYEKALAEVERLRAALTRIKNLDAKHGMANDGAKVMDAFIIALKALGGQVEDGSG
jgi:hypothetical protein